VAVILREKVKLAPHALMSFRLATGALLDEGPGSMERCQILSPSGIVA
jgi:hypothetical protein